VDDLHKPYRKRNPENRPLGNDIKDEYSIFMDEEDIHGSFVNGSLIKTLIFYKVNYYLLYYL
jgi:hypothetical protein